MSRTCDGRVIAVDRDDNPYDLLAEDHDTGRRWAYGTGFTDPLDGVELTVPASVDPARLARQCLALGDDALIYSHRLQEWLTRLPELEEETAIANIALDLLGQARRLLARAGSVLGRSEDELAFFRPAAEFGNVRFVEHRDGDFADLVGRLLAFSTWRLALGQELTATADPVLAAVAGQAVTELTYHRDYAAGWVVRLGDGTTLSRTRMQAALDRLGPLVGELGRPDPDAYATMALTDLDEVLAPVFARAGLRAPVVPSAAGGPAGRQGQHTADLDEVLAEMQSVARAHPGAAW